MIKSLALAALLAGSSVILAAGSTSAVLAASCVNKAGSGTNFSKDGAMFQAWEAVLQATDWGSWSSFMSQGGKVGTAPGYKVSKVSSKCEAGGLGQTCKMQATLCK